MNFFEHELHKICDNCDEMQNKKYVGRACLGRLSDNLTARVEFVTQGTSDYYSALRISVINRNEGKVDASLLRFGDIFGLKQVNGGRLEPHIWTYNNTHEWYGYKPTKAEYNMLTESLNDYVQCFTEPVQELGMKMC